RRRQWPGHCGARSGEGLPRALHHQAARYRSRPGLGLPQRHTASQWFHSGRIRRSRPRQADALHRSTPRTSQCIVTMFPPILVLDDEELVLESTSDLLRRLFQGRAEVLAARTMSEALDQLERHADTLAVTVVDLNLGEGKDTGDKFLKTVRRTSADIFNILNT